MTGGVVVVSGAKFSDWLDSVGLTDQAAAVALGLSSHQEIARYRHQGAPRYIALACVALIDGGRAAKTIELTLGALDHLMYLTGTSGLTEWDMEYAGLGTRSLNSITNEATAVIRETSATRRDLGV